MEHRETGWDSWIVWCTWERKEITMVMVGTPKGKRPLGRPYRCWWKEYMKMEHRETGWDRWIVWCTWERIEITMVLLGTTEGKKPLGRPRCWWKDIIKVEHREAGWNSFDWICLAQDRDHWWVLWTWVMNLCVSSNAGNFMTSWGNIKFSGRLLLH